MASTQARLTSTSWSKSSPARTVARIPSERQRAPINSTGNYAEFGTTYAQATFDSTKFHRDVDLSRGQRTPSHARLGPYLVGIDAA